jgi:pimeloyl-ACP methyl ester carboxylesterase
VEQTVLDDLQQRLDRGLDRGLDRVRWGTAGSGWQQGTSRPFLRELVRYWRDAYQWRAHEARLAAIPQLIAHIDGADLHFLHVTARSARSAPLLLLHGWPDSFYRYHKVIPALSAAHDLVVPSLPGFGFTRDARPRPGDQPLRRASDLLWRLMHDVLGYERFGVVGGDTGSVLAQILAIDHPDSVIGIHITDLGWHATQVDPASLSRAERRYLAASSKAFMADGAYAMVQTTRPRSLAVALADSPVGLASWIVDRFHAWSDGELDARFGKDELLTNIMLYWVTQTIGSSMFRYYAAARSPSLRPTDRVDRPVGLALFPHDIGGVPPRSFAERTLHVTRWTEMPRGGHFAALEEPALFARDVIEFFESLTVSPGAQP